MASHTNTYGLKARKYDTTDFQDASVKRILAKLSDLERAILPDAQLKEVQARRKKKKTRDFPTSRAVMKHHVTVLQGVSMIHDKFVNIAKLPGI